MPHTITIREARRDDVAAIGALLADDQLGAGRGVVSEPPPPGYFEAFDRVANTTLAWTPSGSTRS